MIKNIIHVIQAYFWKRKFSQMSRYTEKYTHLLFIVWQAVLKEKGNKSIHLLITTVRVCFSSQSSSVSRESVSTPIRSMIEPPIAPWLKLGGGFL